MNFIEAFGLLRRLMDHLQRANAKPATVNAVDYFSGVTRAYSVGFYDSEGKIVRHRLFLFSYSS